MKKIDKEFEVNVVKGLVLDEKGNWVTISEKLEREKKFLNHLESGEVLNEGKWVRIDEIKKKSPKHHSDPILCIGTYTEFEEKEEQKNALHLKSDPDVAPSSMAKMIVEDSDFNNISYDSADQQFFDAEEETKFLKVDVKKKEPLKHIDSEKLSDEYLEETMSFDMKTILTAANQKTPKLLNENVVNDVARTWELEHKKSQVLFFSITVTAALFAIIGAIILAFFL